MQHGRAIFVSCEARGRRRSWSDRRGWARPGGSDHLPATKQGTKSAGQAATRNRAEVCPTRGGTARRLLAPLLALPALLAAGPAYGAESRVDCQVLYETREGIYVDAGRGLGIREKTTASLERGGERILQVEVVKTSEASTFLRIVSRQGLPPRPGETLSLVYEQAPAGEESSSKPPSPTVK